MRQKNNELDARAIDLNLRKSQLNPLYFPMGIVKDYTVYW